MEGSSGALRARPYKSPESSQGLKRRADLLSRARDILVDPEAKKTYDDSLRSQRVRASAPFPLRSPQSPP